MVLDAYMITSKGAMWLFKDINTLFAHIWFIGIAMYEIISNSCPYVFECIVTL